MTKSTENNIHDEITETIGTATYSPEDNKIRIYPDYKLDRETYDRVKAAGFKWAPKQELFVAPMWTPKREDLAIELCGEVGDEDNSLLDRAEFRAERFGGYSDKRGQEADAAHKHVKSIADGIPFGQPILVGHHSEKRARRDAKRIEDGMRQAVRLWDLSEYWKQRAASALRHAEYKERPDVRARRIKKIEANIRRVVRSYTPDKPNQIIMQRPWACPVCGEMFCKVHKEAETSEPHVFCGPSRGGSWVPVRSLPAIEKASQRWLAHYENRLAYEKAMLGEQGRLDLIKKRPRPKQKPILNYRAPEGVTVPHLYQSGETETFQQVEMTKGEYKKIYGDWKGTKIVGGSHRVRIAVLHNPYRRVAVFLTDSKEHKKPVQEP